MKKSIDEVFEVGKKYTVCSISSSMAMSSQKEIQIVKFDGNGNPVFKYRGKRKLFIYQLRSRAFSSAALKELADGVFEGWDQPVKVDTASEGKSDGIFIVKKMRGNTLYNFVESPEVIKAWIEAGQLNPYFEMERVASVGDGDDDEVMVYPELYKGGNAVIDRILDKAS